MIINMTGGGGGTSLNFDVKRYSTEADLLAATPKANTIGIISTTEMTSWIIDANQPDELTEGMVWISVGTSSAVEFNALKKNGLQIYPLSAKQRVDGALVDVEAMSYQNGEWVNWITYLFSEEDGAIVKFNTFAEANASVTIGENGIVIAYSGSGSYFGSLRTAEKIDLSKYNSLCMDYTVTAKAAVNSARFGVTSSEFTHGNPVDVQSVFFAACISGTDVYTVGERSTLVVDISDINEPMFCGLSTVANMTIHNIWLE